MLTKFEIVFVILGADWGRYMPYVPTPYLCPGTVTAGVEAIVLAR